MNILRVILATIVIFGAGAMSGYFIGKSHGIQSVIDSPRTATGTNNPAPPMEKGRRSMLDRMQRDLSLSDSQRDAIKEIFAKSSDRSKELWKVIKEPMDAEVKRVHEEIKAVLTPEQAVKFEELSKRHGPQRSKPEDNPEEAKPAANAAKDCSVGRQCFIRSAQIHRCAL